MEPTARLGLLLCAILSALTPFGQPAAASLEPDVPVHPERAAWEHGQAALGAGRIDEALRAFQDVGALDPANPDLYNNLGVCFVKLDQPGDAVAAFDRARALAPGHQQASVNLSRLLVAHRQPQHALTLLETLAPSSAAVHPPPSHDIAAAYYHLGCLDALSGQLTLAQEHLQQAIALDPQLAQAHDALGQVHEQQGDLARAKEAYTAAHRLAPRRADTLQRLTRAAILTQDITTARWALERLTPLDPTGADTQRYEAITWLLAGQPDRAALAFEHVTARFPEDASAWKNLAVAYNRVGDVERADAALAKARALSPETGSADE